MPADPADHATELLLRWNDGDHEARDALVAVLHRELRAIAARRLRRERRGHTLQPTALVNEAYLRLVDQTRVHWHNRAQFLSVAAVTMRRILVDHARRRHAEKRDARLAVAFDEGLAAAEERQAPLVALDDALEALARLDARQAKVVELRYFGGLSIEDTAGVLGLSPATVKREWATARLWLRAAMERSEA